MKKGLQILVMQTLMLLFVATQLFAQVPGRFTHQAVMRGASGQLLSNQNIGVQVSILGGSANGTAVYVETHSATTNANGLMTIEIGGGSAVTGTFAGINWGGGSHFLKVEADLAGGTNYGISSTSELLSVPYALYAANPGPTGAQGPVGPAGNDGAQGPAGPAGPQGPAGNDGAPGAQGPVGPAGNDGAQGPAGPAGPQGPAGNDGAPGAQGPVGPAGNDGAAGAQGPAGPAGPQGPAGNDGAPGAQGPVGPAGNDGAQGPAGPAGPQGPAGNDGAPGAQGPAGPAGNDGAQGPAGPAGPQGPAGNDGAQGAQGPAGPAGNDGAQGPAGPAGPQGPAGPAGGVTIPSGTPNGPASLFVCNGTLQFAPCAPTLTTAAVSGVSTNSAVSGGNITNDGGATVSARGVAYGTSSAPTIAGSVTSNGSGSGAFTSNISGLSSGTAYFVRAYATNSAGTAYGNEVTFSTTACSGAPSVSGPSVVCVNANITLTASVTGGSWSSSNNAVATVNASGVVSGVGAGSATITYTIAASGGCPAVTADRAVTVNPLPNAGAISGGTSVNVGSTLQLSSSVSGGSWTSSNASVASVNASGLVSGVLAGSATITYTVTNSCGTATATATITVNANTPPPPSCPTTGNVITQLATVVSGCNIGDTVVVPVTVAMASGISSSAISMAIDFDTTKLRPLFTGTTNRAYVFDLYSGVASGFLSNYTTFSNQSPNPPFTASTRMQLRMAWFNLTPVSHTGLLFNLKFVVRGTGSSQMKWDTATPGNCEWADEFADIIPNQPFCHGGVTCP